MHLKIDILSTLVNSQSLSVCTQLYLKLQEAKQSIERCPVTLTSSTLTSCLEIVHCLEVTNMLTFFVNHVKKYNWMFGLKSLQYKDILAAFLAFCDKARSLACQFCCGCDDKNFVSGIWSFLHTNKSSIALCLSRCQSGNGLVCHAHN